MILGLLEVKPELIVKLFNDIFLKNSKIFQWSVSIITPIFKSGLKTDPSNFRIISPREDIFIVTKPKTSKIR